MALEIYSFEVSQKIDPAKLGITTVSQAEFITAQNSKKIPINQRTLNISLHCQHSCCGSCSGNKRHGPLILGHLSAGTGSSMD